MARFLKRNITSQNYKIQMIDSIWRTNIAKRQLIYGTIVIRGFSLISNMRSKPRIYKSDFIFVINDLQISSEIFPPFQGPLFHFYVRSAILNFENLPSYP